MAPSMSAARSSIQECDDPTPFRGAGRVDVLLLAPRAHDDCRRRKPRFAHHVFGMNVGRRNVEGWSAWRELTGNVRENRPVSGTKPTVDDQRSLPPHDNAYVGQRTGCPWRTHRLTCSESLSGPATAGPCAEAIPRMHPVIPNAISAPVNTGAMVLIRPSLVCAWQCPPGYGRAPHPPPEATFNLTTIRRFV